MTTKRNLYYVTKNENFIQGSVGTYTEMLTKDINRAFRTHNKDTALYVSDVFNNKGMNTKVITKSDNMTEKEYKEYISTKSLPEWLSFAITELELPTNEASIMWNNHHNTGKYLICESREDNSTRLFIRNVTNRIADVEQKEGWWNTFTITKNKIPKGLWLAKVVSYRLDRNGFLNLEVETIAPLDSFKFYHLFSFTSDNGTWNSIAWFLMIVQSDVF